MIKQSRPLVTIVTPSFNSADYLEAAIASLQAQNYPRIEHIVIDGQSTDGTPDILRQHQPAVVWLSEPDNGQADALNKGFRLAQGEIIGWLNADDTYQAGALDAAVDFLHRRPEIDLVYGNLNFIDEYGHIICTHASPSFSIEKLLYAAIIPQSSMFFRRHILDDLGGVNPALHYVLDWEFTFRVARRYNVAHVPQSWGNFRIVDGTKSVGQQARFWPEIIPVLQQTIADDAARFTRWGNDALFMAHLLAALEFARSDAVSSAQKYVSRAFELLPTPDRHPAVLASGLYRAAMFPWHSAFRRHPLAEQALDNLSQCLLGTTAQREILAFLNLRRACTVARQGDWPSTGNYLTRIGYLPGRKSFYNWRTARMMLGAIVKP